MSTSLQGTQMQLPVEQVKKLETLRNTLNLDRGVIVQVVLEQCFDKIVSEHGQRILAVQNERSLAKLTAMSTPKATTETKPKEPTTPTQAKNDDDKSSKPTPKK